MAKRRVKKTVKKSASSPGNNINDANAKEPQIEEKEDASRDQEVERRTGAIKAMRDVEIEHLLTGLRLLRSYFNSEQLNTPVLQFFEGNLPNLSFVRNGKDGQFEVQWKDKDGNFSTSHGDIHDSLLHHMSMAFPECPASAMPSFPGGFEFSSKMGDLVMEEHSDTHILGQDGLQTPGVSSQRLSVGATPKTARLPKRGEMLLSVHGSPLGIYKEDNMESIRESEEG